MKVCLMCEGSYPYVTGGVSSWVHMLMTSMPDVEFYISSIVVDRSHGGQFKYRMPPNLVSINEIYLQDEDYVKSERNLKLTKNQVAAFRSFIMGSEIDWVTLFDFFASNDVSINSLLMGKDMLDLIREYYDLYYARLPFSDFLWTYRSMMLPLCILMKNELPKADIYHSASTGYSGVLACMAKYVYNKPAILTEHGIYTREREEEVIRSPFFNGVYKDIWIDHFYKLSNCAYSYCDIVISLFETARELQIELGCGREKTLVIPNGVNADAFDFIPGKEDPSKINIGMIARVSPIKDVKTMISSFAAAKERVSNLCLYIMGGVENDYQAYYDECVELVQNLGLQDVYFTGNININDYMGRMDMIVLTSISEGQPIAILEAMSAKKPCIVTRVGNCEGLVLGEEDGDEPCGIVTSIMSVKQISDAIVELATDEKKRIKYGEAGRKRVEERYPRHEIIRRYLELYKSMSASK